MNDTDQSELEQLKGRQARLGLELAALGRQLVRLEERLKTPTEVAPAAAQEPAATAAREGLTAAPPPAPAVAPPPRLPTLPRRPVAAENQAPAGPVPNGSRPIPTPPPTGPSRPAQASPPPRQPAAWDNQGSLELRLGTYWLARLGVALVLTGLAFFGNYAYQKVIVNLGPGGKVGLLYLASAMLLGAGAWWQRRAVKESLRNYAQVLFAGGLAAVYFTTYAAHHLEPLAVISSAVLDGALLLAWAGFMVWVADRWKSEVLALLGVMLAYYTSVITRVGSFTLYSNLVLSVAAVFFLARNRWATLTCVSLAGTYAAYGFWRFFDGSAWHWAEPQEGLWEGASFLMGYWLVFTAAVFLSRDAKFAGRNRAGFLTLNNGAFFTLFLLTMLLARQGGFWQFALVYGAVLLVLAEVAGHLLAAEPLARDFYLAQGLLLVTVGSLPS